MAKSIIMKNTSQVRPLNVIRRMVPNLFKSNRTLLAFAKKYPIWHTRWNSESCLKTVFAAMSSRLYFIEIRMHQILECVGFSWNSPIAIIHCIVYNFIYTHIHVIHIYVLCMFVTFVLCDFLLFWFPHFRFGWLSNIFEKRKTNIDKT